MAKFKKGDRVRSNYSKHKGGFGTVLGYERKMIAEVQMDDDRFNDMMNGEDDYICINEDYLDPVPKQKTWETLEAGDVLERSIFSYDLNVIEAFPNTLVYEKSSNDKAAILASKKSLINAGWKIKGASEDITEMTHEEVEKELGKRIKIIQR